MHFSQDTTRKDTQAVRLPAEVRGDTVISKDSAAPNPVPRVEEAKVVVPKIKPDTVLQVPDSANLDLAATTDSAWKKTEVVQIEEKAPEAPLPSFLGITSFSKNNLNQPNFHRYTDGFLVCLLVFLVFLAGKIRFSENKRFKEYFIAMFNARFTRQLFREEKIADGIGTFFFGIATWLTWSWFVTYLKFELGITAGSSHTALAFLEISGLILGIYLLKKLIIILCGTIFDASELTNEHRFNVMISNAVSAFAILPLLVILHLAPDPVSHVAFILVAGMASLTYLVRISRLMYTGISGTTVSGLYIFLYICTLEILPVAVMVKLYLTLVGR